MSVHVDCIRPGIVRLEFPAQGGPSGRVNCWAIRDGAGWALVDTGDDTGQTRALWDEVFASHLKAPVTSIICTHHHRDHIGQAGWLSERFSAPVSMSAAEWDRAGAVVDGVYSAPDGPLARQLVAGGMTASEAERVLSRRPPPHATLPPRYRRLEAGDVLRIGTMRWRVGLAGGHSPAALILVEPGQNLMVVGDQVLETITPHIGVPPMAPAADPLGDYLSFLETVRMEAGTALGLPGHGPALADLPARARQLIAYHEACLQRLLEALETPRRCIDLVPVLFRRRLEGFSLVLGITETQAHLNRLLALHKVRKQARNGIDLYLAAPTR